MWNKNEVKGKSKEVTGSVKNKVGEWTNNPDLEQEGEADQVEGKVQGTVGTVERKAKNFIDDVKRKVSDK